MNAVDDVVVGDFSGQIYAYSTLENGLGVHRLTPGHPLGLFSVAPVTLPTQGAAVVSAGITASSPPYLVTSGTQDAKLHELLDPQNPETVAGTVRLIDRGNYFTQVFEGLGNTLNPPGNYPPTLGFPRRGSFFSTRSPIP